MPSTTVLHGTPKPKPKPVYDPAFTDRVIAATGPNAHARLAEVMPSLVRHLHDFAREVGLTVAEWSSAVGFINAAGKMSDEKRNETQLLCDILGLESLVDEITTADSHTPSTASTSTSTTEPNPTPSSILGPFHRPNAPILPPNSSIASPSPADTPFLTHFTGRVLSTRGTPIPNATLDIWHAAPNGKYEQQDETQPDFHLRGRFSTDTDGRFSLYCLRPAAYPIPDDGPGGKLLALLDRRPWRPAHIHVIVEAEGYAGLTTQLFDSGCEYLRDDSVFAVKRELVVGFVERMGDSRARWALEYDFVLSEA